MRLVLSGTDWRVMGLPPHEWVWRRVADADVDLCRLQPGAPPWTPATVPGDVQSDLMEAGEVPVFWRDLDSRACEWTSDRDWVYWKDFEAPAEMGGRPALLQFEAVDHHAHVFLNGSALGDHAGAYTPFEVDATAALRPGERNRLVVVVEKAPREPEVMGQIGWTGRIRTWKPRFAYGWDWCTRLVPLGITGDVTLTAVDGLRITDMHLRTRVEDGCRGVLDAAVTLDVREGRDARVLLAAVGPDGSEVGASEVAAPREPGSHRLVLSVTVPTPQLWWPNGMGSQPLYRVVVTVLADDLTLDRREARAGFRTVRALPNEGAPPDALPYVLELNGVRTYIKGWNWVPLDQLYGRPHEAEYRHAIRLAQRAHCNLLRVWGGGLLERKAFYDACDEAGILVWQDFFQSSSGIQNSPSRDAEYVAYVRSQAERIVPQIRNHPSLVLWCGGNELFESEGWVPLTQEHPVIDAIHEVVRREDTDRLFLPTTPSGPVFAADPANCGRMHDVHGNWQYMGDPAHYAFYNAIDPLLHSEFGAEGAANLRTLRRVLSEERLWPPDSTNPAWVHHGAWWLNRAAVERLFGPLTDIESFVRASQWVQYEGLRYAVEAGRRGQWRNAGTLPWQLNEAWPNASCTNAVDYFGYPKPAYYAVQAAYAPWHVSAAYDRLQWACRDRIAARLWCHACVAPPPDARACWQWCDALSGHVVAAGEVPLPQELAAPTSLFLIEVVLRSAEAPSVYALRVRLRAPEPDGWLCAPNTYLFSTFGEGPLSPLLSAPPASLTAVARQGALDVRCTGSAFGVSACAIHDHAGPYLAGGYVPWAVPGEVIRIGAEGAGEVQVEAWNAPPCRVTLP